MLVAGAGLGLAGRRNARRSRSAERQLAAEHAVSRALAESGSIDTAAAPDTFRPTSLKKSLPLSSTTMNAGKSTTSIFHTASMPSSGYSTTSTRRMQSCASRAAGPPIDPR